MFKNYLKVAWVSILKNKTFSFINIFGLALGLSLCLLIIAILKDQFNYDKFHPDADRVYRINTEAIRKTGGTEDYASSPYPMGQYVKANYPYVEKMVTMTRNLNGEAVANSKKLGIGGLMTSPEFFDVFGFDLLYGNKKSALAEPYSAVLTEKAARRFFGNDNPIGKTISFNSYGDFKITGVLKAPPGKSHLEFDVLGSLSTLPSLEKRGISGLMSDDWKNYYMSYVYVRLRNKDKKAELEKQLAVVAKQQYQKLELESRDKDYRFYLQRLEDITPGPMLSNNMGRSLPLPMLWFLTGLAIVVIVSAGFNYNSLSLAKSLGRAKEIGIRKASGAMRKQLIGQFLLEAVLTALLSLILAWLLYETILKPGFQHLNLINEFDITLNNSWALMLLFAFFSVLVGLISGIFPSLYLSGLNPVKALKDNSGNSVMPKLKFRKVLLIVQFSAAMIFIVTLVNMYRQLNFLMKADYGFTSANIVNIDLRGNDYKLAKQALEKYSAVEAVAGISHPMGTWRDRKVDIRINEQDEREGVRDYSIDAHYLDMIGQKPLAGKGFSEDLPEKRELQAVVNEKFLEHFKLGSPAEAIGKTILVDDSLRLSICGVLKNFNFKPFVYEIEPLLLRYNPGDISILNVKIKSGDQVNTLAQLERIWKSLDPSHSFDYSFFTDDLRNAYADIKDITKIVAVVALMAIAVACLGLLGLVLFIVRRQVKEIGIRKVLGANVQQVIIYLSRNFVKLLLLASVIGLPLGILINQSLLGSFAFRINPLLGYVIGFFCLMALALMTIGIKILYAAKANPVKSLRTE